MGVCSVEVDTQIILAMFCIVRELVDSLCRDGADAQHMQYLRKSRITSPQIHSKFICVVFCCRTCLMGRIAQLDLLLEHCCLLNKLTLKSKKALICVVAIKRFYLGFLQNFGSQWSLLLRGSTVCHYIASTTWGSGVECLFLRPAEVLW